MAIPANGDVRPELKRRSQRVRARIAITVRVQDSKRGKPEQTQTMIVNAHGALIILGTPVSANQFIIVENPKTQQELLCRVAKIGATFMGKTQVAIEFIKPSPEFWGIAAPPADWGAGSPLSSARLRSKGS